MIVVFESYYHISVKWENLTFYHLIYAEAVDAQG